MDFGKLDNIENVDFSLPPDHPKTGDLLRGLPPRLGLPHVYIGCTGWGVREWVGHVYPKNTKPTDYLKAYGKQFNTIELNTTHYRTPSVSDVLKWKNETPDDFRFAPKMLQLVSHAKNLGFGTGLTMQFCEAIQAFEEKLGVCFIQIPPHFGLEHLKTLETYLKHFPKYIPLAIELRNENVFANEGIFNNFFDLMQHNNTSTVITDVSGRRDVLHQRLTTSKAVIRFIGNGLHKTDFERIDAWVERLKTWFIEGLHEVYFFTHEPDNLLSPELALYLHDKIKGSFAAILRGPVFFEEKPPSQFSLF